MKYMNQMLNRVFIPQQRKLMGSSVVQAPGQVQRRSGESSEGSEEGLGGFGAEPGQTGFLRRFRIRFRRSGRLWCRARSGSTGFRRRPEKVPGSLGAKPRQVQQGSGEGSGEGSREGPSSCMFTRLAAIKK